MCYKTKRRQREAIRLFISHGAAVEESRKSLKLVFRAENVGANRWIVLVRTCVSPIQVLGRGVRGFLTGCGA